MFLRFGKDRVVPNLEKMYSQKSLEKRVFSYVFRDLKIITYIDITYHILSLFPWQKWECDFCLHICMKSDQQDI